MLLLKKNNPALLIALLVLACAVSSAPVTARAITTPHFVITHDTDDEYDGKLVARYAEQAMERVAKDLGYSIPSDAKRVPVRIFSSRRDFLDDTGIDRKKMIVGRAWSGSERIEIDASGAFARVERVVAHEVTHVVVARILGPRLESLPLWANEGIARVESGEWSTEDDDAVGEAISNGDFIPLHQIAREFPSDSARTALAYSEGTSFIHYILSKTGPGGLRTLLRNLTSTGDFARALQLTTGASLAELEKGWRHSASHSYDLGWLSRNLPTIIGIVMALLCVSAYLAIKRRQKWNTAKWMIEESYDDGLDYGPPPE